MSGVADIAFHGRTVACLPACCLPVVAQVAALAKALDRNGDGRIDYHDFIRSFHVQFADHSQDFLKVMTAQ